MVAWVVIDRRHSRRTPRYSRLAPIPILGLIPPSYLRKPPLSLSCTYVESILQPVCFHIHAWNGGVGRYPLSTKKRNHT